jgi:hypothetical protein
MKKNQITARRKRYEEAFEESLGYEAVFKKSLEARGGIEPPIKVLQTFALPLGYRATESGGNQFASFVLAIISSGQFIIQRKTAGDALKRAPTFPASTATLTPSATPASKPGLSG